MTLKSVIVIQFNGVFFRSTLEETTEEDQAKLEEKQQQRTFLRKRFLQFVTSVANMPAKFTFVDGQTFPAKFGSTDISLVNIQVKDLRTPLWTYDSSLLRSNDLECFRVNTEQEDTTVME